MSADQAITNARAQAALELASQGLPVFPCNPKDKAPLVSRGFYAASRDPAVIRAWFERWPDALVGVPTGEASGIDAVDTDPRNGCGTWFEDNDRRMPATRIHTTRGGGKHILFRHAPGLGCSGKRIHAGVDVKADGGYIIWHPASGCEVWLDWGLDDLAEWPDWLLPLARAGQSSDRSATGGGVSLADRLPPSGDAVVALLSRLPNPLDADRGVYTTVMPAAQGCIDALSEAGSLGDDDESRIGDAAVAWAERWEGYAGTDERAKWEDDWSKRNAPLAGWQTLEKVACALIPGYHLERAQAEFTAVPPPASREPEPLMLDRGAPLASAKELVRRRYMVRQHRVLHHRDDTFFIWTGTHYREMTREEARSATYSFLDDALHPTERGPIPFNPTRNRVGDVIDALSAEAQLPGDVQAPALLTADADRPPARELLACDNGLLHLPTRRLLPHAPAFFGVNALPYAFDPGSPEPVEWLRFLGSVWPDDQESIATLQELFGLLLTAETRHQKLFLLVGPKRSGKGTIGRILAALLGRENVCNPTLAGLATNFGLEPLIGKPLAIISDARLGGRTDAHAVAERLLSISGEDGQTIDRKFRAAWHGTLPSRFVILSNELPRLTDASGALASRFIVLQLQQSFYGREDQGLTDRLLRELPSILAWSLAGLDRLNARGHFVQPASAREAISELEDLASPIGAFIKDRCTVGAAHTVDCDVLFVAWVAWCREQHRDAVGTKQTFGRDLRAAIPMLDTRHPRVAGGGRQREYCGVGLPADAAGPLSGLI